MRDLLSIDSTLPSRHSLIIAPSHHQQGIANAAVMHWSSSLTALCALIACAVTRIDAFTIQTRLSLTRQSQQLLSSRSGGGMPENPLDGGELLSTLASLDREWRAQQLAEGSDSRWTKLVLPSTRRALTPEEAAYQEYQDYVYVLEPPSGKADVVISFLGGAGLGQFPQVAYNEFLIRVSDKLNAAVITSAYQVGLDHYALSKQNGDRLRRAYSYCLQKGMIPENLPIYCLGHSLGCKLQVRACSCLKRIFVLFLFRSRTNLSFAFPDNLCCCYCTEV